MPNTMPYVRRYTRVRDKLNGQMVPIALVCAQYNPDTKLVNFGFSKKHANDNFVKAMARKIADNRLACGKYSYEITGEPVDEKDQEALTNEIADLLNEKKCKHMVALKKEIAWALVEAWQKAQYVMSHPKN